MKPYIMLYSDSFEKGAAQNLVTNSTIRTFAIESDDKDCLDFSLSTEITKVNEALDHDTMTLSTYETRVIENSDTEQMHIGTMLTERTENNDDDYLTFGTIVTNVTESNDNDYIFQ